MPNIINIYIYTYILSVLISRQISPWTVFLLFLVSWIKDRLLQNGPQQPVISRVKQLHFYRLFHPIYSRVVYNDRKGPTYWKETHYNPGTPHLGIYITPYDRTVYKSVSTDPRSNFEPLNTPHCDHHEFKRRPDVMSFALMSHIEKIVWPFAGWNITNGHNPSI